MWSLSVMSNILLLCNIPNIGLGFNTKMSFLELTPVLILPTATLYCSTKRYHRTEVSNISLNPVENQLKHWSNRKYGKVRIVHIRHIYVWNVFLNTEQQSKASIVHSSFRITAVFYCMLVFSLQSPQPPPPPPPHPTPSLPSPICSQYLPPKKLKFLCFCSSNQVSLQRHLEGNHLILWKQRNEGQASWN